MQIWKTNSQLISLSTNYLLIFILSVNICFRRYKCIPGSVYLQFALYILHLFSFPFFYVPACPGQVTIFP